MNDFCHPMTRQKSRKVYQCVCCAYAIEKGAEYCKQTGAWEGDYFTNRFHPECWIALLDEGGDFEFMPGEGDPPEGARTMKEAAASMSPDLAAGGKEGAEPAGGVTGLHGPEWISEDEKTLEHLAAFLQRFDVPHAAAWRDWIDNASKHFTAALAAAPADAEQPSDEKPWTCYDCGKTHADIDAAAEHDNNYLHKSYQGTPFGLAADKEQAQDAEVKRALLGIARRDGLTWEDRVTIGKVIAMIDATLSNAVPASPAPSPSGKRKSTS